MTGSDTEKGRISDLGVNMARILGDAESVPERVGWGQGMGPPTDEGYGERICPFREKNFFRLKWCFGEF